MKRILFLLTIALLNLGSGLCKIRQSLRIMSYNIRIGIGMDQQTNLKRIAEVINKIQPDYVGLQEVDSVCERSGWINQYAELARVDRACIQSSHLPQNVLRIIRNRRTLPQKTSQLPIHTSAGKGRATYLPLSRISELYLV